MRLEAKEREAGKLERSEVAEEEEGKEEGKLGSGGFVSWWLGGRRWSGTCNHGLEDSFFIFEDYYIYPYSLSSTAVQLPCSHLSERWWGRERCAVR